MKRSLERASIGGENASDNETNDVPAAKRQSDAIGNDTEVGPTSPLSLAQSIEQQSTLSLLLDLLGHSKMTLLEQFEILNSVTLERLIEIVPVASTTEIVTYLLNEYEKSLNLRLTNAALRTSTIDNVATDKSENGITDDCDFATDQQLFTSQQVIDGLWRRIPTEDFWNVIFPRLCDITFFARVPQNEYDQRNLLTASRLQAASHDGPCLQMWIEDRDPSSRTAIAATTDLIFRKMWFEFTTVLTACLRTIWSRLTQDLLATNSLSAETSVAIKNAMKNAYELAMLRGHVVACAPLSVCVSLDIVNSLNCYQIEKLHDCLRNRFCGEVFDFTVSVTMLAALHYGTLIRGFRPLNLWPLAANGKFETRWKHDESSTPELLLECPWFLINHCALGLYHMFRCFAPEIPSRQHSDVSTRVHNVKTFARLITNLRGENESRRVGYWCRRFRKDDRELSELARYLNLCIVDAHLVVGSNAVAHIRGGHVLERHFLKVRYSDIHELLPYDESIRDCSKSDCRRRYLLERDEDVFLNWVDNGDGETSDGENVIPATPQRYGESQPWFRNNTARRLRYNDNEENDVFANNSNQTRDDAIVSSSSDVAASRAGNLCAVHKLLQHERFSAADKYQLLHPELINAFVSFGSNARCQNQLWLYQLYGMDEFPAYAIDTEDHLNIMRDMYLRYTVSALLTNQ